MQVSVVIPLYNKARHIGRALNSVFAQTVSPAEIIVVNDGSTDDSAQIVVGYDDPRIHLINQPNAGVSAARNRGIAEATGNLIAFLDADDAYSPDFIATILRLREAHPYCGAFATAYSIEDIEGQLASVYYSGVPDWPWEGVLPSYVTSVATGEPIISSSSVAVLKSIMLECGGFPAGERLGEDLDTWLRIALRYPIAFSTHVCAIYHRTAENRAVGAYYACNGYRLVDTAFEAIRAEKLVGRDAYFLREYACRHLLISAWHCILCGKQRQALMHLRRCKTRLFWRRKLYCLAWACVPPPMVGVIKTLVQRRRHSGIPPVEIT